MAIDERKIAEDMKILATAEPVFAAAWKEWGTPLPRIRPRGYPTLLRAIVSQQISTAAAATIWGRLTGGLGDLLDPHVVLAASPDLLRKAGLSARKVEYAKSLAEHVRSGSLPLDALPADDEEAIALISSVRGLGRWTAEVYLLFAEGRPDVFPAGDRALQVQAGRMFMPEKTKADGKPAYPGEKALRTLADGWHPCRGVAALFLWHCYNTIPL